MTMFSGCSEDGDNGVPQQYHISTVEELHQFISKITFNVTLSDGGMVEFSPGQSYSELTGRNYTSDDGGFTFTPSPAGFYVNEGNGNALLTFNEKEYNFDMVICTSVAEMKLNYPHLNFHPSSADFLIYVAVEFDNYSEREVIMGDAWRIAHILELIYNPNADDYQVPVQGSLNFPSGDFFYLYGAYTPKSKGFASTGNIRLGYNYYDNASYNLELNCVD